MSGTLSSYTPQQAYGPATYGGPTGGLLSSIGQALNALNPDPNAPPFMLRQEALLRRQQAITPQPGQFGVPVAPASPYATSQQAINWSDPFGGSGVPAAPAPTAPGGAQDPAIPLIVARAFPQQMQAPVQPAAPTAAPAPPPTQLPAPSLPITHSGAPETSNWENPAAVTAQALNMRPAGGTLNIPQAEEELRNQRFSQVMNGSATGQTFENLVRNGVPIPQAAALARQSAAFGAPEMAMTYANNPQSGADVNTENAYYQQGLGRGFLTGDFAPVTNFLQAGGAYSVPFTPQGYQTARDGAGNPVLYEQQPGGGSRQITDMSQTMPQTPQDLVKQRADYLSAMFKSQLEGMKDRYTLASSYYRNGANSDQAVQFMRMLPGLLQSGAIDPQTASPFIQAMIGRLTGASTGADGGGP